jgi:hypothetical protein
LIDASKRLGGKWGIFALPEDQVPVSQIGRMLATLGKGDMSQSIFIEGEAVSLFKAPVVIGPI